MTRDFTVTLGLESGEEKIIEIKNNRTRLCRVPINERVTSVKFTPTRTFGADAKLFSFDLY